MRSSSNGFTLLELVVVIVIIGIIAVTAVSRLGNKASFSVRVEQENLIAALTQAQQLAMAGQPTRFVISTAQSYSIRVGTPLADYQVGSIKYPATVEAEVSLSPTSLTVNYDNLGQPDATQLINVAASGGGSVNVCIEASGYAHACP